MKFRKKPIVIEAIQFCNPAREFQEDNMFMGYPIHGDERGYYLIINTLEGISRVDEGDWIITGVKGELYPCKPDIFGILYEPME